MDSYRRKIKLRIAWWLCWYVLCTLAAILEIGVLYDYWKNPTGDVVYIVIQLFALFASLSITKTPNVDRLVERDLKKDPENIYAKTLLLERKLADQKRKAAEKKEHDDLSQKVKDMEDEMKAGE